MVKQFLITRPQHDKETAYLYSFSKAIVQIVKEDKKLIKQYGTSEDYFGDAPSIGLALSWNLLSLDIEGDPKASF